MLLKPYIPKVDTVSIKSLPSNEDRDSQYNHPAYFGTQEENTESIEIDGRLLMLTTMYHEWNLKLNKHIHDEGCIYTWPLCKCTYAKHIRASDIGLDKFKFEKII